MNARLFLYSFGIWFILVIFAILNGAIRNAVYKPKLGELPAHQISTVIMVCIILLVVYLFIKKIKIDFTKTDLILIGVFWLFLTIVFEFIFGHYVMGNSWEVLFADYKIHKGRLWSLVLITTLIAPYFIGKILKRK